MYRGIWELSQWWVLGGRMLDGRMLGSLQCRAQLHMRKTWFIHHITF